MSILENSFTSQRDSPTRRKSHSLCQQLQQLGTKIGADLINTSKNDTESDDNSFISPNSQNKLENEPEFEEGNKSIEEDLKKNGILQQDKKQQAEKIEESSGPKTITLIQDDLISKDSISMNMSSKLSQYSTEVDNESFATFLSMRDTSYSSLIKNFEVLFTNISNLFTERLCQISSSYLSFLKIKHIQQKSYLSQSLPMTQNKKNHIIYIDCKAVADNLASKLNQQRQKRSTYVKQLQQLSHKLQKYVQSCLTTLESKCKKIKDTYNQIEQIVKEMNDLMIPLNRKKMKKSINSQIYSSGFIRTKYLMSKERMYLNLMSNYLQNVLSLVGYICLDLEPKNCLMVKQCMLGYAEAMANLSNKPNLMQKNYEALNKTNCYQETYEQVSKMLQLCIPDFLKSNISIGSENSQKKLKRIIESLISQSQIVYIPVIQLENKDCLYHSKDKAKVNWIKVNHQQKYKSETIQEHQTYVILTHQGDLILELLDNQERNQQKMAILKLKNLKLSKKNNQVYLTDKGSGMLGMLFSSDTVLGSLVFQPIRTRNDPLHTPQNLTDQFIQKVKFLVDEKKQKKGNLK